MRRALLVSVVFPPSNQAEAMLACKRLGAMPGWTVDVVTVDPAGTRLGHDEAAAAYAAGHFARIERVAAPWPMRAPRVVALPLSFWPDLGRWAVAAMVRRAESLGVERYDAMVSWSQFHSSHLAALALKRRHPAVPWLAHFSDPWARNPYNIKVPFAGRLNERLERSVMGAADALSFTTEETRALMLEAKPAPWSEKSYVMPHAFDPGLYPPFPETRPGSAILVRYLGTFYRQRTPLPLFAALQLLQRRNPAVLDHVTVELVGSMAGDDAWAAALAELPAALVRAARSVDYRRSLAMMCEADLLLVIDAPARTSVFLPSKLVDYIGAERPVLAITPPGATAKLVDALGGWCADPDDPVAIADAFERALAHVRGARGERFGGGFDRARYGVDHVRRLTAELLDRLAVARVPIPA